MGEEVQSVEKPFKDIGKLATHPSLKNLENVGHDVLPIAETAGLTALQAPFLGPYALPAAAAETGGINSAARGGSLTQDITSAGEGAALAYGGQQLAGAFPETSSSISNAIPNLGIGDAASSLENTLGLGGSITPDTSVTPGTQSSPATSGAIPATTPSAGATGGTGAIGSAAPAGVAAAGGDISGGDVTAGSIDPSTLNNVTQSLGSGTSTPGSAASSALSSNVGTGTVGTQGLPGAPSLDTSGLNTSNFSTLADGAGSSAAATPTSLQNLVNNWSNTNAGFNTNNASNIGSVLSNNAGSIVTGGALAAGALSSLKGVEGERQLKNEAGNLNGQGQQLASYLQSGTLPAGLQAGANQAIQSAKAAIRSQFASQGLSGSSAEQQALASVDERAQAASSQMAMQLLQTGISEEEASSQLYQDIIGDTLKSDATLGSAFGNFASSLTGGGEYGANGGKGGVTINYPSAPQA